MFLKFREQVIRALGEYGDERFIKETEHADLCSTIAFKLAKEQKRKPNEKKGSFTGPTSATQEGGR